MFNSKLYGHGLSRTRLDRKIIIFSANLLLELETRFAQLSSSEKKKVVLVPVELDVVVQFQFQSSTSTRIRQDLTSSNLFAADLRANRRQ